MEPERCVMHAVYIMRNWPARWVPIRHRLWGRVWSPRVHLDLRRQVVLDNILFSLAFSLFCLFSFFFSQLYSYSCGVWKGSGIRSIRRYVPCDKPLHGHDTVCFVFYGIRLGSGRGHETLYICLLWLCLIRLDGNTLIPSRVGKEMASRKIPLSLFLHWWWSKSVYTWLGLSCFTITCLGEHEYPLHSLCYWIEIYYLYTKSSILHTLYAVLYCVHRTVRSHEPARMINTPCVYTRSLVVR